MRNSLRRSLLLVLGVALVAVPSVSAQAATRGSQAQLGAGTQPACGGPTLYKANGTPWQCTFDDEFNGTSLDTNNWSVQTTASSGYHSGPECFVDSPNNVSVSGGTLNLTVRAEPAPFTCTSPLTSYTTSYTSGMVTGGGKFSQTYGRFEVRAKLPPAAVKGLQESFWLWPVDATHYGNSWPQSGEIDIAEGFSQYPDRVIPYIHYVPKTWDLNVTNNYCRILDISQFHTYAVEWTSSTITIKYDGKTCVTDNWKPLLAKPAPFDQPFFLALTQALGIGGNAFNPATTPLPATTQIDYVRIWQ
jgi:beta-glucanase (GH16 family)